MRVTAASSAASRARSLQHCARSITATPVSASNAKRADSSPTKSARPSRYASVASIESPEHIRRSQAAADSRRAAATLTRPGKAFRRISGKPNVALRSASTIVARHG
eukprot:7381775-Prymnesium_polylepis.2